MSSRDPLPLSRTTVDRDSYLREDETELAALWESGNACVLLVYDGQTVVDQAGERLVSVSPDETPEGERYYLGRDGGPGSTAYFAVRAPFPEQADGARPAGLREVGTTLGDRDAGLAVHAIALERWHATHKHCPRCGHATEVVRGGSQRNCPADGSSHFPRVDPAVIMLVYDDHGRCVLGRKPSWPKRRFSVLAGFVEPGESLEHAVAREVAEEVHLDVTDVSYVASQPWPFPSSLMLGFTARSVGEQLAADDWEIAEAHWFGRDELAAEVAAGTVRLPPGVSIARKLLEGWYGGPL